jgi:hypothetical protein
MVMAYEVVWQILVQCSLKQCCEAFVYASGNIKFIEGLLDGVLIQVQTAQNIG